MIPTLLVQISLIIIIVRCVYVAITMLGRNNKPWLDILFYIAVAIVALHFLF